ncbi:SRPBCC family protein [Kitasatospora viridis]|uniref:Uncharacterized protein YndB with AHSA1/START domain n=1 Tax=Kitasatospora viridis TaxID=281105 RepID=A0A561UBB0_9ACTN|nr:SRPBCC family protein [Kitasatospora viridis]TWF96651.1 uncharacterized protein YndB with AHSA1/START domain [Kitasatospora viridis]
MSVTDWIGQTSREVRIRELRSGAPGCAAVVRRTYQAGADELWSAVTSPERIAQWFLPLSGDLRAGGTFQLEGNAGGEILACDPPHRLRLTWTFGGAPENEVTLTLTPAGHGRTTLELEHAGPGEGDGVPPLVLAVGVGWDPALVGLGQYLSGDHPDRTWWFEPAQAREFTLLSVTAWAAALDLAKVAAPEVVAATAEQTLMFYAPE